MRKLLAITCKVAAEILWPSDQRSRQVIIIDEPPIDEGDTAAPYGWDEATGVYRSDWRCGVGDVSARGSE